MRILQDCIEVIALDKDEEDVEDIYASGASFIFPDDTRNLHGDPGSTIVYKSQRFGNIKLTTADPLDFGERQLFAHYLWNAGLKVAELISERECPFNVQGERVLELGSGVGLAGIVTCLAGAEEVVLSDYPAELTLKNLRRNAAANVPATLQSSYSVEGHAWGEFNSAFAHRYAGNFTRIIAADCYWMDGQHENLARSMLHLLKHDSSSRILAVAAFHTGRAIVASFFDTAVREGLIIDSIYEEDVLGRRREWTSTPAHSRENSTELKRWLVIAQMRRKADLL